jgi:hypothetical protein
MLKIIELPYKFKTRSYQNPLFNAFFIQKKKRLLAIWHRRAGKDKSSLNIIIGASQQRVGIYYYLFPELKQARRDIWEGIDNDGMRFIDHFPKQLIKRIDKSEMLIEFHNGSIFRLCGSDRYDSLMGSNPVGIIFAEYSLQNPRAWDFLRPILMANGGWALFQYTPRGTNHGEKLYKTVKNNSEWFSEILTVDDTEDENGNRLITEKDIQSERDAGMSEDMIRQEFYCDFNASVRGAYFSLQLARAENDNRIYDFPIERNLMVSTYWDIGYADSTGIWFVQTHNQYIKAIHYYENQGQELQHYINYLHEFRTKMGIIYEAHYSPHDGAKHEFGTGLTIIQQAAKLGIHFIKIPRIPVKSDAIEMARSVFNKFIFHKTNCEHGLACLREYHAEYNEVMGVLQATPCHNWASHCADAFMAIGQMPPDNRSTPVRVFNR